MDSHDIEEKQALAASPHPSDTLRMGRGIICPSARPDSPNLPINLLLRRIWLRVYPEPSASVTGSPASNGPWRTSGQWFMD